MQYTNVDGDDAAAMHLSKQGYGSLTEILSMDTEQFLDLIEFERIQQDIERHYLEQSKCQ